MALPGRGASHSSPPGGINTPRSEEVFKINGSLRAVLSPPCPPGSRQEGTARSGPGTPRLKHAVIMLRSTSVTRARKRLK